MRTVSIGVSAKAVRKQRELHIMQSSDYRAVIGVVCRDPDSRGRDWAVVHHERYRLHPAFWYGKCYLRELVTWAPCCWRCDGAGASEVLVFYIGVSGLPQCVRSKRTPSPFALVKIAHGRVIAGACGIFFSRPCDFLDSRKSIAVSAHIGVFTHLCGYKSAKENI